MKPQVDASTISAGTFFSESKLIVPDFQRRYRWSVGEQVKDFWSDLHGAVGKGEYFLGLVILSDLEERREVVDGQQRLVTLTILANVLRIAALRRNRRLVAESVRTVFLYSMDFQTELEEFRIELTDPDDQADLASLIEAGADDEIPLRIGSAIHSAHAFLTEQLEEDLERHDNAPLRVGQWVEFIRKNLTFAVFKHPDRGAAFRVYEVINSRGKDLTPSELIKAYLIGSSGDLHRDETHRAWRLIEEQLEAVGAADQLTTFIRHSITLEHGYVTPRDLYQVVSGNYSSVNGVRSLLTLLTDRLPAYVEMIDPGSDVGSSDRRARALIIADALSLTRFRPLFLLAPPDGVGDERLEEALRLLVPGSLTGQFGTGSIEAQFARAARRIHGGGDWDAELRRLSELKPTAEEFEIRLQKGVSKLQALVLRSSFIQRSTLPALAGFPHQVRPRNGQSWSDFDDEQYRAVGGLLANWVLTKSERRPQGARTPETVEARLISDLIAGEDVGVADLNDWTAEKVVDRTREIAHRVTELWYADR